MNSDPETIMRQAGMTANDWLMQAQEAVNKLNLKLSDDAKAKIICAFLQAASQDQHTMTIRDLAEQNLFKNE